jgi:hypothetical protein
MVFADVVGPRVNNMHTHTHARAYIYIYEHNFAHVFGNLDGNDGNSRRA